MYNSSSESTWKKEYIRRVREYNEKQASQLETELFGEIDGETNEESRQSVKSQECLHPDSKEA